jgi:U3 small nucleolar RNA-associated protein 23
LKVIIDGNFIAFTFRKKLSLKDDLAKALDEKVFIVITSCVMKEIQELNPKLPGLLDYTMKYTVEKCTHGIKYPEECIREFIGKRNQKKHFVATQDMMLRRELRKVPGVPIVYFDNNLILVEKPSIASEEAYTKRESLKQEPQKSERKGLSEQKKEANNFMKEEYKHSLHFQRKDEDLKLMRINGRLKRKAKGPNPLSCLKKKNHNKDIKGKEVSSSNNTMETNNMSENQNSDKNTNNIPVDNVSTVRSKLKYKQKNE